MRLRFLWISALESIESCPEEEELLLRLSLRRSTLGETDRDRNGDLDSVSRPRRRAGEGSLGDGELDFSLGVIDLG